MTRVLINLPALDMPGGVANYYTTLRPLFDQDKVYFEIGNRRDEKGIASSILRQIADFAGFFRLLGREHFDLVHLNPSLGPKAVVRDGLFLLLAKLRRKKVLVFFRGWDKDFEAVIRKRYAWLFRYVYGKADAMIVLAEEFVGALRGVGIEAPVWVDTTVVADSVVDHPLDGGDSGSGGLTVLYMSRIEAGKGCDITVRAFGMFREQGHDGRLIIAGDGSRKSEVEALVDELAIPDVEFSGYVSGQEKTAAFLAADVFFYPTAYGEGMPNAVLEAMGFGLPVITRPVAGLKDFFVDGQMGYMSDSRDPAVFAGFLTRLAVDPDLRSRIGRENRSYAASRFTASRVVERLEAYYSRVIAQ